MSAIHDQPIRQPISDHAPLILILAFVPIAAAITNVAYATYDLHADLTEYFAWSRDLAWGYDKHPPLGAWITAAWFSVFPATDWAFSLLAAINCAAGLYAVDLVARRYLSPERRLLCLALLLLTPAYSFHGMRYNASNLLLWA